MPPFRDSAARPERAHSCALCPETNAERLPMELAGSRAPQSRPWPTDCPVGGIANVSSHPNGDSTLPIVFRHRGGHWLALDAFHKLFSHVRPSIPGRRHPRAANNALTWLPRTQSGCMAACWRQAAFVFRDCADASNAWRTRRLCS